MPTNTLHWNKIYNSMESAQDLSLQAKAEFKNIIDSIAADCLHSEDAKQGYKALKTIFKVKPQNKGFVENIKEGNKILDKEESMKKILNHFVELHGGESNILATLPPFIPTPSPEEIEQIQKAFKNEKAVGLDGIPNKLIQHSKDPV